MLYTSLRAGMGVILLLVERVEPHKKYSYIKNYSINISFRLPERKPYG
jgi:hypothetical protein